MDDELLDLVNKNDTVIGTINRKEYHKLMAEKLGYIRVVELFIVNSSGELFVPIRTADKTIAPNGFDYSAAGHVGAGDEYLETVIRETKEELYLDISEDDLEFVTKAVSEDIRYIRSIYLMRNDETPPLNPADYVSAEWLLPDDLISQIDSGHPTKSSLRETVLILKEYLARY